MRANFAGNTTLRALTRVADRAGGAFTFPELLITTDRDDALKQTRTQWAAADSTTGLDLDTDPGAVRLTATLGTQIEEATSSTYQTAIDDRTYGTDFICARLTWSGPESPAIVISDVRCYLDPVRDGIPANKQVAFFELCLYAGELIEYEGGSRVRFIPLCPANRIAASGTAPANYTFDYTTHPTAPQPKALGTLGQLYPVTFLVIRPLKADGQIAGNVGWAVEGGASSVTDAGGNVLTGSSMSDYGVDPGTYADTGHTFVPRMRVRTPSSYSATTITFSGAGNRLDLGGTPTGSLELTVQADTPGGSSITAQVRDPDVSGSPGPWTTFVDGQTIQDLGLAVRADGEYDVRVTLTPGTANRVTPSLRRLGLRELTSYVFKDHCRFDSTGMAIDPVHFTAEIEDLRIHVLRNGERDYRDRITMLLSQNHLSTMEVRLWWGHPDTTICARAKWMPLGSYDILDYTSQGGRITLICQSPLARVSQPIPLVDPVSTQQELLEYPGATAYDTPAECEEDLLDIIGLPDRYRGQGLGSMALGTSSVAKAIADSDALVEIQALNALCGAVKIPLQGRLTSVDLYGPTAIEAIIPRERIRWGPVGPGYRNRVPVYRVPFGWDRTLEQFDGVARGYHTDALAKLNAAPLANAELDPEIAKWFARALVVVSVTRSGSTVTVTTGVDHNFSVGQDVLLYGADQTDYVETWEVASTPTGTTFTFDIGSLTPTTPATGEIRVVDALPQVVADRMVTYHGPGTMFLPFTTDVPYPEIHCGSRIACELDELVMRAVETNWAIRGPRWVIGIVVAEDPDEHYDARAFTLWVPKSSDIVASTAAAQRLGFAIPEVLGCQLSGDLATGAVTGTVRCKAARSVYVAVSTSAQPDRADCLGESPDALSADGNLVLGTLDTLDAGETLYVSILAAENVDGTGALGTTLGEFRIVRVAAQAKTLRFPFALYRDFVPIPAPEPPYNLVFGDTYVYASGTVGNSDPLNRTIGLLSMPLPIGVTLTAVRLEGYRATADDELQFELYRYAGGGTSPVVLADDVHTASPPAWEWLSDTLNELVGADDAYVLGAVIRPDLVNTDARAGDVEVDYTVPGTFISY